MNESLDTQRRALLDAALLQVPFEGWSPSALRNAAQELDMPLALARDLFPRWPVDAILLHSQLADAAMVETVRSQDGFGTWGVRGTLVRAIEARLSRAETDKEAVRAGLAKLALPQHAYRGTKAGWATVDAMWGLVGEDQGLDYYSKRSLLSGVYLAVLTHWLNQNPSDLSATLSYAERQLDRVVAIMKPLGKLRGRLRGAMGRKAA